MAKTLGSDCPTCGRDHLTARGAKYLRISEDREGEELGITRQDEDLDELACKHDVHVIETYSDNDISASTRSTKQRPRYSAMIEDAKRGRFTVILAYTSKRLTRRPREHEDLIELAEQHGISYFYLRSPSFDLNTSNGRMVARFLAAQDANESEEMGERVARARQQRQAKGDFGGGRRPFGFEADGVTIRPDEAAEIAKATDAVNAGVSMRQIVADLRDRNVPTAAGGKWHTKVIREILMRPRNAGISVYKGEEVGNASWEPIVTEDAFRACVARLSDPSRRTSPGNTPRWLGSLIYNCGETGCESVMYVTASGGSRKPSYRCRDHGHLTRRADVVDEVVETWMGEFLRGPDAEKFRLQKPDMDTGPLRAKAVALRQRRDNLGVDFAEDRITRGAMIAGTESLSRQIEEIESLLDTASDTDPLDGIAGEPNADELWAGLSLGRKRTILRKVAIVTIMPTKAGRRRDGTYFDPDSVKIERNTP